MKAHAKPTPVRPVTDLEVRIRDRAYQLYLNRGGEHGQALNDWLQAEGEISGENRVA
jgi:hypothetical protein